MIDWLAFKILILFYETDIFLFIVRYFGFLKDFKILKFFFILESLRPRNSAANFRTLGQVQKKLLRFKKSPQLPDPSCFVNFKLTMSTLSCNNF